MDGESEHARASITHLFQQQSQRGSDAHSVCLLVADVSLAKLRGAQSKH